MQNLRISPLYRVSDWRALSFQTEADWETAVSIFVDRIEARFLRVLDQVARIENGGFVLLGMDCAMIETLQQFREGEVRDKPPSTALFVRALRAPPFSQYFPDEGSARAFYKHFRCGLLHRAQTGPRTRIRQSGAPVSRDGSELIVNRDGFHALVRDAYARYVEELRRGNDVDLRRHFRAKMGHVANMRAALQMTS